MLLKLVLATSVKKFFCEYLEIILWGVIGYTCDFDDKIVKCLITNLNRLSAGPCLECNLPLACNSRDLNVFITFLYSMRFVL